MALTHTWQRPEKCDTGSCAEARVSEHSGNVLMHSTEHPAAVAAFTKREWLDFIAAVKAGQYDLS